MRLDAKPYQVWQDLKKKFPVKTVHMTDTDLSVIGLRAAFKTHRAYVEHLFKSQGVEITRWQHNYDSLEGNHPQLGVIFLAGDSALVDSYEAHVLIGHNAKYVETT